MLHAAVVVQMVAAEVGQHGHIEAHAAGAILIQGMRRYFHGHGLRPLALIVSQGAMDADGVRRGIGTDLQRRLKPIPQRPNQGAGPLQLT